MHSYLKRHTRTPRFDCKSLRCCCICTYLRNEYKKYDRERERERERDGVEKRNRYAIHTNAHTHTHTFEDAYVCQ